jgi:hypothetical protein
MSNITPGAPAKSPATKTATRRATAGTSSGRAPGHPPGKAAASRVRQKETVRVALPMIGGVTLPRPQDMAYYLGIGALVALEMLEWPAAVALAAGHALVNQHHNRALEEFGEALEEI